MSSYVHLVRRFRELTPRERRVFLRTWLLLPAVELMLRTLGTPRLLRLVERLGRPREHQAAGTLELPRLVWLIAAAARLGPLPRNCLRESIVLVGLLHRRGIAARLRIGVRREPLGDLEAHAWVEVDGVPVTSGPETAGRRYFAFPRPLIPHLPASR